MYTFRFQLAAVYTHMWARVCADRYTLTHTHTETHFPGSQAILPTRCIVNTLLSAENTVA